MRRALSTCIAVALSAGLCAAAPTAAVADDSAPAMVGASAAFDANTPDDLHILDRGNRTVWLDWNEVEGATAYKIATAVYANPSGIPSPSLGRASIDVVNSNGKVAGITNGVTYSFSVAAVVAGVTSAYSTPVVVGAPDPAGAPADFHITGQGNARINFDWVDVPEATGYRIKTSVVDAHGIANPSLGSSSISLLNSLGYQYNLTNGVDYSFTVVAIVDGQEGPAAIPVTAMAEPVPNAPGTPSINSVTASSVAVKWTAATLGTGATPVESYQVSFTPLPTGTPVVMSVPATTLTAALTTAAKGVSYSVKVAAVNSFGQGLWSATRTITATNKTNTVRNLTASRDEAGTTVNLDWLAPSNNGGQNPSTYTISISPTPPAGYKTTLYLADTRSVTTGLDASTTYRFTVRPYNDGGSANGVTVGSLAGHPNITGQPQIQADGSATLAFTAMSNDQLDYEATASQEPLKLLGETKTVPVLRAPNVATADSIECNGSKCVATWEDFAGNVNGRAWTFKVRGTDNAGVYSSWDTLEPNLPADPAVMVSPVQNGPLGTATWSLKYNQDWKSRGTQGIYSMSVNGVETTTGASGDLGGDPGDVSVEFTGIGGTSQALILLPPPAPGEKYKVGDTGPAGGIVFATPSTYGNPTGKYFEVAQGTSIRGYWHNTMNDQCGGIAGNGYDKSVGAGMGNTEWELWAGGDASAPCKMGATDSLLYRARHYDGGGYTDWFLPSYGEMALLTSGDVADKVMAVGSGTEWPDSTTYATSTITGSSGVYTWSTYFWSNGVYTRWMQKAGAGTESGMSQQFAYSYALPVRSFE